MNNPIKKIYAPFFIKNPYGLTDAQAEQILTEGFNDTFAFAKYFLPDYSKTVSPFYQPVIFKAFDNPSTKPIALIITRDGSKTTMTKALVLKKLLYAKKAKEWGLGPERYEFIGWSSSSIYKSQNQMAYIQTFLEQSEIIKYFFGSLKGKRWSLAYIETIYGDTLRATSNLAGLRGDTVANVETGSERYSIIIADDSENETNTITADARTKFSNLVIEGMLPAIERTQSGNKFIFINTPVHYAGFTQDMIELYFKAKADPVLKKNLQWNVLYYPAILPKEKGVEYKEEQIVKSDVLPEGIYAWPERLNREYLENAYYRAEQSNTGIAGFFKEYMLEVQNESEAKLGRKVIRYWDGEYRYINGINYIQINDRLIPVNIFIGSDPATDINKSDSDYSVILVMAMDADKNVYVLHYDRQRSIKTSALRDKDNNIIGPLGVVEYITKNYDFYHAYHAAVEDVPMTRTVFQDIEQLELLEDKHRRYVHIKPAGQEKLNKIHSWLAIHFNSGKIYIKRGMTALEQEIIRFGKKMGHDDTIESLYFAHRYAFPPDTEEKKAKRIEKKKRNKKKPWYLM